jgi:Ca2+-binding EF-hand superfamily protein
VLLYTQGTYTHALNLFLSIVCFTGNGEIDFDEFLEMMSKRQHINPEEELREAFKVKYPLILKQA